ncbi:hypothetical protein ABFZ85_01090 [Hyphococcus formosus]|uniref:hypothetical protein n=1 Tax=Hyphococcus formosus TaxID=3143534 RepID=UPI00398B7753
MSSLAWLRLIFVFLAFLAQELIAASAFAQNTSGVSNPNITEGRRDFGYRLSVEPTGGSDDFAHRFDYGHSFSDRTRMKFVVTQNNKNGDIKIRHFQTEAQYQFRKVQEGWNSAVQVQGRIPTADNVSGRARFAWLNSIDLSPRVELRANVYAAKEVGDLAKKGIRLETRSELTVSDVRQMRVGVQMFNRYNTTAAFGDFNDQSHQVGPIVRGRIANDLSYGVGALFGISRAASDAEFRIFLGYSL